MSDSVLEMAQRFLRVNGVWDMSYGDGRKLSQRLAEFVEQMIAHDDYQRSIPPRRNFVIKGLRDANQIDVPGWGAANE